MGRDTDSDWRMIGEGEPYFGVLSHERFLRRNLTPEILAEFWQTGKVEIAYLLGRLRAHFGEITLNRALDFGCGVGRLSRGMADVAQEVFAIDISPGMLEEARRNAPANITFTSTVDVRDLDWINSIIVFQHIPPERGYAILDDLLGRLKPGGVISIQLTIYRDRNPISAITAMSDEAVYDGRTMRVLCEESSPSGAILMYDYDLTRVVALTVRHGIEVLLLEHTNHGGYHGVRIFGRRTT
ncbi:MAG: class I SAM-dependent methyltransferase [Sphingobium sp.]|nr:class I SAM-dependent methyltransferase [Sphingobium sp.]